MAVLTTLFACNSSPKQEEQQKEEKPVKVKSSLESFADSLVRLDRYARPTIEKAAYYFQKLVPSDSLLADSAAVTLLNTIWNVADTVNQQIWKDGEDYMDLVYGGGNAPTQKQKDFEQSLHHDHLNLQGNGEGDVLAVLDYDWFNGIVQPKTSIAVDQYLSLLAKEEKQPALQDAGLTIEMKELIERLITSEKLLTQKLPFSFSENVQRKNKFYTNILLTGTDNSPALENEIKMTLTTEFKQGYDYLITTYPNSEAAQKLKEWLVILKTKNRKKFGEQKESAYN